MHLLEVSELRREESHGLLQSILGHVEVKAEVRPHFRTGCLSLSVPTSLRGGLAPLCVLVVLVHTVGAQVISVN